MAKKIVNMGFPEFLEDNVKSLTDKMPWMKERDFKYAESIEEVKAFVDKAIEKCMCALDLETTGLNTRVKMVEGRRVPIGKIVGIGVCYNPSYGLYIPINHREDSECNLPEGPVLDEIKRLCANCIIVFHNAKFDMTFLKNHYIEIDDFKGFEDTMLLARCFDLGQKDVKLKSLSHRLLNQRMLSFEEVVKNTKRFDFVSPKIGYIYGASDPVCTLDLYHFFMNEEIVRAQNFIYNIEKRVVFVVMEMESNLVRIDVEYLKDLQKRTGKRIEEIKREVFKLAKEEFNLASPLQLGKILFEKLGFEDPGKTESGQYKTDSATLNKIADVYPVVKKIVEFRELEKVLNTYINNLLKNYDEDGFIKLSFHQSGTDTGRFSSPGGMGIEEDGFSGVNVQSIPKIPPDHSKWLDMRKAIIAREGKTLVAIDYANEEMRVATNLSKETTWINALNEGIDFHTATGGIISNKTDLTTVTKDERKIGKTVNFLSLYMGGPRSLSQQAKIPFQEARRILKTFFAGVPKLKSWMNNEIKRSQKSKIVKTIFGRTRPLNRFYDSKDKALIAHGDRCVINTQVQGASADIMKIVMARLHGWIHRNGFQDDIKVLITMHDELVYEITTDKLDFFVPEISKIMRLDDIIQGTLGWEIPLEVDVSYGDSWKVSKDFFKDFPELKERLSEPLFESEGRKFDRYSAAKENCKGNTENPKKELETTTDSVEKKECPQNIVGPKSVAEAPSSEEKKSVEEEKPQESTGSKEVELDNDSPDLVYTIRNRRKSNVRWLNNILQFLTNEKNDIYTSQKKILKLKDPDGYSFLVSEIEVPVDAFTALVRYHGL